MNKLSCQFLILCVRPGLWQTVIGLSAQNVVVVAPSGFLLARVDSRLVDLPMNLNLLFNAASAKISASKYRVYDTAVSNVLIEMSLEIDTPPLNVWGLS